MEGFRISDRDNMLFIPTGTATVPSGPPAGFPFNSLAIFGRGENLSRLASPFSPERFLRIPDLTGSDLNHPFNDIIGSRHL